MAYLHCHTRGCDWSQDDFWDLHFSLKWISYKKSWWKLRLRIGYNPISRILSDISWLWKPKWMGLDKWIIDDMTKYTGVNVKVHEVRKMREKNNKHDMPQINQLGPDGEPVKYYPYYTEYQVFSWKWLWLELVNEWQNFRSMKWWTWNSWQKAKDTAVCPKCGLRNFDID